MWLTKEEILLRINMKPIVLHKRRMENWKKDRSCNCKLHRKNAGRKEKKIIESDEYIRQDIEDLKELEERYASMKIPYMFRRVIDEYIACMESKSERYADLSYIKGYGRCDFTSQKHRCPE